MKIAKVLKALLVLGVITTCACALGACSGSNASGGGPVAATVNGSPIYEEKITSQIEAIRAQYDMTEEEDWANYLIQIGETPADVREDVIDSYVHQELIKIYASELGVSVESAEVDECIDQMKSNYNSDEAWAKALKEAGFSEEDYRESIETSLITQKVQEYFTENAKVSKKEKLESANSYVSYYDGAKRSSHILFGVDDTSDEKAMNEAREQAQAVLDQINAGTIDFAEAAKQYSTDEGSAKNGGDVGWDALNSFVSEYTTALDELGNGEVSGLVESQFGIHIIKCTEVFTAPEKITKMDQLPEEFQTSVESMAKSNKANDDYSEWLEEMHEKADIVINEMPSDVSYNVDLSQYQEDEEGDSSESSEEAAEGSEEAAEGDGDTTTVVEDDSVEVVAEEEGDDSVDEDEEAVDVELEDASEDEAASEESSDKN